MPFQLPARLIGFNAFGLASDNRLGATNSDKRNFFQYLDEENYPFNLVKVVIFSNGLNEVTPDRFVPLYQQDKTINQAFLENLSTLADEAHKKNFLVQVCLFHYHAIQDQGQAPPHNPFGINYEAGGVALRKRLRDFFTPAGGDPNKTLQKQLITAVGNKLKKKPNIIWELCNEVRMDGALVPANTPPTQVQDNWNLTTWMQQTENFLKQTVGSDIHVCTSSGTLAQNEKITCENVPTTHFDFHFGQWNEDGNYRQFIKYAKERAAAYAPGHLLVCNDDGAKEVNENTPTHEWFERTEGNLKNWAGTAFEMGLGYMLKATYPAKLPWNLHAMRAIKFAHETHPLFVPTAAAEAKTAG
ncbi:MAG TPA: hypothetical protein VGO50_20310 [Pyrinomonadaceae bacterium]|jgi:hypothetical protein|nr:hypothetical protein [Pyrinomonadaceae bacterium]